MAQPSAPSLFKTLINGHLAKRKGFGNRSGPAGVSISGQPRGGSPGKG